MEERETPSGPSVASVIITWSSFPECPWVVPSGCRGTCVCLCVYMIECVCVQQVKVGASAYVKIVCVCSFECACIMHPTKIMDVYVAQAKHCE